MKLFIFGAGFTKAVFPNAPLNRDLLKALISKFTDSASNDLYKHYGIDDIEIALTRLDVDVAMLKAASIKKQEELIQLRKRIESELAAFFGEFCASYSLLNQTKWVTGLVEDVFAFGDVAVNLNYDCLLEGFLDCLGKWSPTGGYGFPFDNVLANSDKHQESPVRVLKIHGSANFIIAPYLNKQTSSSVNFDFDERYFPRSAKNKHFSFGREIDQRYLIAPSYVKVPTVEINYLMLDALSASTKASKLIIVGTSLRPEDAFLSMLITNFLHQPNWQEKRIIIVDPNAEEIGDCLMQYWGVDISNQIIPIGFGLEQAVSQLMEVIVEPTNNPTSA